MHLWYVHLSVCPTVSAPLTWSIIMLQPRWWFWWFGSFPQKECSHKFHLPQRSKPEPVQMWQMLARGPQIAHCATGEAATMGRECVRKLIQLPFQPANTLLTSLRGLIKAQRYVAATRWHSTCIWGRHSYASSSSPLRPSRCTRHKTAAHGGL